MEAPKSKQFCCNYCVKTVKSVPVIFILGILAWSYYAYVYQLCLNGVLSVEVKVLYLIVYHVILVFFLWSYFRTIFTEPSDAPLKFRLTEEVFEELNKNPLDLAKQSAILHDFAENLPIMTFTNKDDVRFCDKCKIVKPDRSHHCSVCRKCVLKMDHHCPWVNNCVSYSNYKYFILFLAYGLLMCIYVVSTTAEYVIKLWEKTNDMGGQLKINLVFLFFIASMFSISLFSLFAYHLYLVSKNRTTLESFRPPKFVEGFDKNGFNLGCCRNIQEVFGKEALLWPFPIATSLGEGDSFPINKTVPEAQHLLFSDNFDQNTSNDIEDRCASQLYTSIPVNDDIISLEGTNFSKYQDLIQI